MSQNNDPYGSRRGAGNASGASRTSPAGSARSAGSAPGAAPPTTGADRAPPAAGSSAASAASPTGGAGLLPALSLPKGGGALRGIGEKFSTNAATGTGSLTVPIATSPGRAGFELALQLGYDSGGGNGPFGLGWKLSIPSITRKTDKGLPRYADAEASDIFVLS